jgi:hypothetical protein
MFRNFGSYLNLRWDRKVVTGILLLALGWLFSAAPAFAQGNAGSIEGVVKDSSGGTVPNARVEIS